MRRQHYCVVIFSAYLICKLNLLSWKIIYLYNSVSLSVSLKWTRMVKFSCVIKKHSFKFLHLVQFMVELSKVLNIIIFGKITKSSKSVAILVYAIHLQSEGNIKKNIRKPRKAALLRCWKINTISFNNLFKSNWVFI